MTPSAFDREYIIFESDTNKLKVGNGVDAWNNLEYITGSGEINLQNSEFVTNYNNDLITTGFNSDFWVGKEDETPTGSNPIRYEIGMIKPDKYSTSSIYLAEGNAFMLAGDADSRAYINTQYSSSGGNAMLNLLAQGDNSAIQALAPQIGMMTLTGSNTVLLNDNGFTFNNKNILTEDTGIVKQQGVENSGKILKVDSTGDLTLSDEGAGIKKYLHRITLNLSDQASGSPPNKTVVIHLDYYSEQETAYTNPNFATIALASSIGCSGYYTDTDTSLTEKNFVYEIALPQSNEFVLNSSFSITIQSTGSSITDEVIGYVLS